MARRFPRLKRPAVRSFLRRAVSPVIEQLELRRLLSGTWAVGVSVYYDQAEGGQGMLYFSRSREAGCGEGSGCGCGCGCGQEWPADMTISYEIGGSADSSSDHNLHSGQAFLAGGEEGADGISVPFDVTDDTVVEDTESVSVTITNVQTDDSVGTLSGYSSTSIFDNEPTIGVSPDSLFSPAEQGPAGGGFTFFRAAGTGAVTVGYTVSGTATNGSDFSGLGGSVTLAANQSSKTVNFNTIDDAVAEDAETVIVTIQGGGSYRVLPGGGTATQTIADNEPTVSVSASGATEGGSAGQVTVSRSGPNLSGALPVPLSAAGAAKVGDDYTVDGGSGLTITIPAGESSKTVPLSAVDDTKYEGNEDGTLTVQSSQGYHIGTGMAGFTITDNDKPVVSISAGGSASEDGATATLTVSRANDDKKDVLAVFLATGGSASAADYTVGPVVIPAGEDSVEVPVYAVDDANHENPEQATFTISTTAAYTVAGSGTATVTVGIADNDKPRVTLSASVGEAAEGGAAGQLTVTRTNDDVKDALAVGLLDPTGTAGYGTDYTAGLGVTILQGQSSATIAVAAVDDPLYEGPEGAGFALDPAGDYDAGGSSTALITIRDNEPTVSVSASGAAAEGGAGASLTVTRSGGTLVGDLSVYLTLDGSAGLGSDYTLGGGGLPLTILSGAASATVTLAAIDDTLPEGTERAVFGVASSPYYRAVGGTAGVDILDNDWGKHPLPPRWTPTTPTPTTPSPTTPTPTTPTPPPPPKAWVDVALGAQGWYGSDSGDEQWYGSTEDGDGLSTGGFLLLNNDFDESPDATSPPASDMEIDGVDVGDGEVSPLWLGAWTDADTGGEWELTWDESKVKVWAPDYDEDGVVTGYTEQSSGWGGTLDDLYDSLDHWWGWGLEAYAEPVGLSASADDLEIAATFTPDGGDEVADAAELTVYSADVDADSDNDDGFDEAEGNDAEEWAEDAPNNQPSPGKILVTNVDDGDSDGIPDYADGFNWDGATANPTQRDNAPPTAEQGEKFVPVTITLPNMIANSNIARLRIVYDASEPGWFNSQTPRVGRAGNGTESVPYTYTAEPGGLRLWTKGGSQARNPKDFNKASAGDFVPPTTPDTSFWYEPADWKKLSWVNTADGKSKETTLYVESVKASTTAGDQRLVIEVDPDGNGPAAFDAHDTIVFTSTQLALVAGTAWANLPIPYTRIGHWGDDTLFPAGSAGGEGWGVSGYRPDGTIRNNVATEANGWDNFVDRDPDRFYVRLDDPTRNVNPAARDTLAVTVGTRSGTGGEDDDQTQITLTETGNDTGLFLSDSQLLMSPDLPAADHPDDDYVVVTGSGASPADDTPGDRTHRTTIDGAVRVELGDIRRQTPVSQRGGDAGKADERKVLNIRVHVYNNPNIPGTTFLGSQQDATVRVNAEVARADIAWSQAGIHVRQPQAIIFENAPTLANGTNIFADNEFNKNPEAATDDMRAITANTTVLANTLDVYFVPKYAARYDYLLGETIGPNMGPIGAVPAGGESNTYVFVSAAADVRDKVLAHEVWHVLTRHIDTGTPVHIFGPATGLQFDDSEMRSRRITHKIESAARKLLPAGDLSPDGNSLLQPGGDA